MRRLVGLSAVFLALAGCGAGNSGPGVSVTPNTSIAIAASSTATSSSLPGASTTSSLSVVSSSTTAPEVFVDTWSVASLGRRPGGSFGGTTALGSGCAPGSDHLPDGVWFGWVSEFGTDEFPFDLACFWPGRIEAAVGNDSHRIRVVPVSPSALVYTGESEPQRYSEWLPQSASVDDHVDNAPGLPQLSAFWVFINDGAATELAQYFDPIRWTLDASAWPGLKPGCCDGGTVAPASPSDPWPQEGWPTDGFYSVFALSGSETHYVLDIRRWLDCDDDAHRCPEWWVGDEVTTDPHQPTLTRRLAFDEDLTVVIRPVFSESAVVGDGLALRQLIADVNHAVDLWIPEDPMAVYSDEFTSHFNDPAFPFGSIDEIGEIGGETAPLYRAPGGVHLTFGPTWGEWWTALEIRAGHPVLYVEAGQIAG